MDHGRTRRAPAIAGLHRRPVGLPKFLAVQVIAKQPNVTEVGIHALPISDGRLGRVTVLHMQLIRRCPAARFLPPQFAPRLEVITEHEPMMIAFRYFFALAAEVEALLRRFHFSIAGNGGDKHALAPNNRRGPTASRHFNLPRHVLVRAPAIGEVRVVSDAQRVRSSELRPVGCSRVGRDDRGSERQRNHVTRHSSGKWGLAQLVPPT